MLRGVQEGFEFGPASEACHIGREQGEVIQAVREQELVVQQQV